MIKIEYNKQTLEVPTQWSDITLGDYERWFDYRPENQRDYVQLVADICDISNEDLLNAPRELFDVISNHIQFIFNTDVEPSMTLDVDGEGYMVVESEDITLGEWIDVDTVNASDSATKISEILAIVCRPIGEEYNSKLTPQRQELFRNLPCDKVLPLLAFFLSRKQKSEEILNLYSDLTQQANQYLSDIKSFVKDGDGIKQLPTWQRIRYTYLIRSLEKALSKCSDSSSIA